MFCLTLQMTPSKIRIFVSPCNEVIIMNSSKLYTFMLCLSVLATFAEAAIEVYMSGRKIARTTRKIRKRLN